jgi:hypothetical protein
MLRNILACTRKYFIHHFCLPRRKTVRWTEPDPETGRINFCRYIAHPWYVSLSQSLRWGWKAWGLWLVGVILPGDLIYFPGGYRIRELGPTAFVGKGKDDMDTTSRDVKARRLGCTYAHPSK